MKLFKAVAYAAMILVLAAVAWLHLVKRIHLETADLGRHIRNGELAWVQHHPLTTNYYSLTNADYPTVCHHWGTGVIFYLVWNSFGFVGLSVFYGAVLLLTVALLAAIAARAGALPSALLATALALPLIGERIEIRPEGFSTLFATVSFLLLYGARCNWFGRGWLWLLPLLQLVWVNIHILFPLGFVLLGIFFVDAVLREGFGARAGQLAVIAVISLAASLINPSGYAGLIEPVRLMQAQEYKSLAENQSIFWMMARFPHNFSYRYCLILIAAGGALLLVRLLVERDLRRIFLHAAVFGWFAIMAVQSARSIAMFGLFFIPIAAVGWERILAGFGERWRGLFHAATAIAAGALIVAATVLPQSYLSPVRKFISMHIDAAPGELLYEVLRTPALWAGLAPQTDGSGRFFKEAGMRGPLFNNYDIGSYVIFHLFPEDRPFIDNRPEAYPLDFQIHVYGAMQHDDVVWAAKMKEYGLEAIFFHHLDMSSWGREFLVKRINDPQWAPVFVDARVVIFARRGGVNQAVIDKHEVPREVFGG